MDADERALFGDIRSGFHTNGWEVDPDGFKDLLELGYKCLPEDYQSYILEGIQKIPSKYRVASFEDLSVATLTPVLFEGKAYDPFLTAYNKTLNLSLLHRQDERRFWEMCRFMRDCRCDTLSNILSGFEIVRWPHMEEYDADLLHCVAPEGLNLREIHIPINVLEQCIPPEGMSEYDLQYWDSPHDIFSFGLGRWRNDWQNRKTPVKVYLEVHGGPVSFMSAPDLKRYLHNNLWRFFCQIEDVDIEIVRASAATNPHWPAAFINTPGILPLSSSCWGETWASEYLIERKY